MARQTDHWNSLILVIGGAYVLSQLYLTGVRENKSSPGIASPHASYQVELSPHSNLYDIDREGRSPLHLAAEMGLSDLIEVYLNRGASIEAPDRWGNTPLMLAAASGREKTVSLLLSKGARVDAANKASRTPLLMALIGGHGKTADVLAAAGANLKAVDDAGYTALYCAAESGLDEWVKRLLILRLDPNALRIHGWSPLHAAVYGKHPKCAQYLLEAGANPQIRVSYGHSATDIGRVSSDAEIRSICQKFPERSTTMPFWMNPPAEDGPMLPEALPETPRKPR